jgi:hypothetical protein
MAFLLAISPHDLTPNSQSEQRNLQRAEYSFQTDQELEQAWFFGFGFWAQS